MNEKQCNCSECASKVNSFTQAKHNLWITINYQQQRQQHQQTSSGAEVAEQAGNSQCFQLQL